MRTGSGKVIVDLIRQSGSKLDKKFRNHFNRCGLTTPQIAVLTILRENGEMRVSDIGEKISLTASTTSGIIDRLEKMGLVARIRDEKDRRVVKVALTHAADSVEYDFNKMMDHYFDELFSKASEEDLKSVIKGLEIFNRILDI